MLAGDLVQGAQGRSLAVDGEDRVGDHERARLDPLGERESHGAYVAVRHDDDAGAGQPAGVDHRRMVLSVGDDEGPGPASAATAPRLAR